jgi:hypothetical protein
MQSNLRKDGQNPHAKTRTHAEAVVVRASRYLRTELQPCRFRIMARLPATHRFVSAHCLSGHAGFVSGRGFQPCRKQPNKGRAFSPCTAAHLHIPLQIPADRLTKMPGSRPQTPALPQKIHPPKPPFLASGLHDIPRVCSKHLPSPRLSSRSPKVALRLICACKLRTFL